MYDLVRKTVKTPITAAVIVRDGKVLLCQRKPEQSHPLKWEFPGGKIEPGEETTAALRRELQEELGIEAEIGPEIARFGYKYPDNEVLLIFFKVDTFQGEPENKQFAQMRWIPPKMLGIYDLLEADYLILDKIGEAVAV
jgi:8-oxo-dGTP diphosphatase